jgi:hypothetical protein
MMKGVCSECGSDALWVWYTQMERQTIAVEIVGRASLVAGRTSRVADVSYDYTGCIDMPGVVGEDESYYCGNCFRETSTIEEMVGLPAPPYPGPDAWVRERARRGVAAMAAGEVEVLGEVLEALSGYRTDDPVIAKIVSDTPQEFDDSRILESATSSSPEVRPDRIVTCDYSVPLTVRVNVDTGEALEVNLHLDSFQSSPPGWFKRPSVLDFAGATQETEEYPACFRDVFISGIEGVADGEYCDGEHPLADEAFAIADRVKIVNPEFPVRFTVRKEGEL